MRFGRIEYLNLLPFHVFMKRYVRSSQSQMMLRHGSNVPSAINRAYRMRKIDAAFISSIRAKGQKHLDLGIIADGPVQSVLLLPSETSQTDRASETSNALVRVLGLEGRVLIGDPALRAYLEGVEALDLAEEWHKRYGLPFVFGLLSYQANEKQMRRLADAFARRRQKIPQYLLKRASARTGVRPQDILAYLEGIHYRLDHRARRSLHLFWRLTEKGR
ncbi:MqnA/MqnD/SBP family protein [Sulfurimonas sp. HSL-1656]|uniref:MqnA/MqnD/SBP family protein n=1 Tax=Thiomicrolovo subterrani TaxID=3131934 RepID=UPI0031F74635